MSVQHITASLSILLFTSCLGNKRIPLYKADCNGQSFQLSVKEKQHFAYTEYWMEIKVGKLKAVAIKPREVIDNTPYSFALLNKHPYYLYDTVSTLIPDKSVPKRRMIILISPSRYSKTEFEKINACLSLHHKAMEEVLYEKYITPQPQYSFYNPQFAGIVYADTEEFINVYQSKETKNTVIIYFSGDAVHKDANGEKIPAEIGAVQFAEVKEKPPDGASKYTGDAVWRQFTHTKTGNTLAMDYDFYITEDNLVYGVRK